ncbi:MAG: FHA domain-containing protein [Bacteroidales bacterium]|nr:FHA domain-containing protein [Bacteroidales bacterium]
MPTRINIGRDPRNTIVVDDTYDTVSNDHADIYDDETGELFLRDHSSNGTKINGQRIQNTDVRITPGDEIMLAGVYPVDWTLLRQYFPAVKRPTVGYNNRGGYDDEGRRTVNRTDGHAAGAAAFGTRGTERFDSPTGAMSSGVHSVNDAFGSGTINDGTPVAVNRPPKPRRQLPWTTIITMLAVVLTVMLILGVFVFDDVIYSIF